jgi:hypothetical protein
LIEISRSLIRSFRAVLKKIATVAGSREPPAVVVFRTDRTGLRIQASNSQIALEHAQPGCHAAEDIGVPADALGDCEARKDTPVRFETNQGKIVASWQDKAVPQIKQYKVVESSRLPRMPALPALMEPQPVELLAALRDASDIAGTTASRYSVAFLQLRGHASQIASTDGRQLLAQSGFTFGWDDDVLVPACPVFGCRELHEKAPLTIGKSGEYVTLRMGPWTLHLAINKDGHFPKVDRILKGNDGGSTVLQFDPEDVRFLLGILDSLPGAADESSPVTIEADGQVIIRARGSDQPVATELLPPRSEVQGKQVTVASNRQFLAQALHLGFAQVRLSGADKLAVCRDEKRQYVWQLLGKNDVLPPTEQAIRLSSADAAQVHELARVTVPDEAVLVAPDPSNCDGEPQVTTTRSANGATRNPEPTGIAGVLAQAEAIKDLLRQAYTRTHQLVIGVKRYRKQAQAVKSALGSLRQLQEVAD